MLKCCIIYKMHCTSQRRYAALIWTNESLVRPYVLKVLDLNMFAKAIDTRKEFIALIGFGFFVTLAKWAIEGTP
jgi:hypothetical protein